MYHIVIEIGYLKLKWVAVNQYFLNAGFVDAFEQEDFDEVFDKAVNEVAASGDIYNCIECKKTYKTLGGVYNVITKQDIRKTSLFIHQDGVDIYKSEYISIDNRENNYIKYELCITLMILDGGQKHLA